MSSRPTLQDTFLEVADVFSTRSTCSRRKVGAVIAKDGHIISTGYNGAPAGDVHCVDGGCPRGKLSYDEVAAFSDYNTFPCVAIHAEANAIIRAGFDRCRDAVIYITCEPCLQCEGMIRNAGIIQAVWPGPLYGDPDFTREY